MKEDISGIIQTMAENLGVATEHVYSVLMQQQIISGIIGLVWFLVLLGVGVALSVVVVKSIKHGEYKTVGLTFKEGTNFWGKVRYSGDGILPIFLSLEALACFVISMFVLTGSIGQLINPEYYAVKEILNVFSR